MFSSIRKGVQYTINRDTPFWRGVYYGMLFIAMLGFIGLSLGIPTGIGAWLDVPLFTLIGLLLVYLGSIAIAAILAVVRLPLPRVFIGEVISVYLIFSFALPEFNMSYLGAAFIASCLIVLGFIVGTAISMVVRNKGTEWFTYPYAGAALFLFIFTLAWLFLPGKEMYPSIVPTSSFSSPVPELNVKDPSLAGDYEFHAFTYGSGEDLHRDVFAEDVDYITESVDASGFLSDWHVLRNLFWGFDEGDIPLNGRVWMPKGEGPFPLVLMVHGNHKMEHFSDSGYGYLGELLASRGFIAVSVGEDFINFSIWSEGIDWDMTIRAWVLLQHLIMIEQASEEEGSPFLGKVDMENIALLGHSRGGQAAALAAGFDQFFNENNHEEISLDVDFSIKAVVAVAPIDRLVEDKRIRLKNIDYFTIQGSQDSDVNTFYGQRQYRRITYHGEDYGFKASLYIEGANHGQFNSDWGDKDTTMPTALLLNKGEMITGEEQRHIAKLYISAFLEASLHGDEDYLPILRDYHTALQWLPDTAYVNQFQDSTFMKVSDYEDDRDLETTSVSGGMISGHQLETWEEQDLESRTGNSKHNRAALLAWDGQSEGRYTIQLPEGYAAGQKLDMGSKFTFSLANNESDRVLPYLQLPEIIVELVTQEGVSVQYPLRDLGTYPPIIHSRFTKNIIFEHTIKDGNLGNSSEPVFQMYEFSLSDIIERNEAFEPSQLEQVSFIFEKGIPGKVFIDDIGFSK